MFKNIDTPTPNMITVEEIKPGLKFGRNLLSHDNKRQRLQIKATRMKNNKFCISWYPTKLRYFAHHFNIIIMTKGIWKKLQPHAIAIGIFLLISILYCLPAIQGLVVNQSDIIGWKGMAQSSFEFKEKYGYFPLWINSLFGGMPGFQVAMGSEYNINFEIVHQLFTGFLPSPAGLFFLSCIGMYVLCCVVELRTWIAIFGALAFAFSSYSPILAEVGHNTKLAAMGYMPLILAAFLLMTKKQYVTGFALIVLFTSLQLRQNHIQITYYTLLLLILVAIFFGIKSIIEKKYKHLALVGILSLVGGGISGAGFSVMLLPLNEYAKETMRGGRSELTSNKAKDDKTKGGLDKDYAFSWSYGIGESLSFALPAARGGSSSADELGDSPKSIESMQDIGLPDEAIAYFKQFMSPYWGDQPNTSGPVYFGIIVLLLCAIGFFVVKDWNKGWIIAGGLLGILLSWGSNFSVFNYFLFDHLPFYNKFRAPSMSLVIPQLCFALLAAMALQSILYGSWDQKTLFKKLKPALVVVGLMVILMIGGYVASDFKGKKDKEIREAISQSLTQGYAQGQQPTAQISQKASADASTIMSGLIKDRERIYLSDLVRSLIFLALGGLLIFLSLKNKIKPLYASIAICLLSFVDLIGVDTRYLNKSKYISEEDLLGNAFTPNAADLQIKKDTGYFRVFDQTENFTNDSRSAYFHNSIGGYHPAKLALYQDIIENQIAKNNMQVLNMLNTKYYIISNPQTRQPIAIPNPENLGPAWLAYAIKPVDNADQEMKALDSFSPKDTVIVDKREITKLAGETSYDSTATIKLVSNKNDQIEYEAISAKNQIAVFSEVYYPYGWKAFVDGKETAIARVNYLLRGIYLPAGKHKIEFIFKPESVKRGDMISLIIGIISWLIVALALFWNIRQARNT